MKPALPITPGRFLGERLTAELFARGKAHRYPREIGICVSGGPDSMALAYLLKEAPHPYVTGKKAFSPHAFVIDHGARDGSREEALWVKRQLETLNIDTDVRTIEWPKSVNPASLEGFELQARAKRYDALASLANTHRVKDLFTGHHRDDMIETIMLRLLRDRTLNPFSYSIMRPPTPVPSNSTTPWVNARSTPYGRPTPMDQARCETFSDCLRLHRPLLGYQKSDLIATCDYFKVRYIHDKTNFDPQLTVRNTIRHLRKNYTLPRALQGEALLSLRENTIAISDVIEEQARKIYLDYVLEFRMHNQSGVITLRLKTLPLSMEESQLRGFSYLMESIIALVSPMPPTRIPIMLERDVAESILDLASGMEKTVSVLTSNVKCVRVLTKSPPGSSLLSFSRQPISLSERVLLNTHFDLTNEDISRSYDKELQHHTFARLWDGRFWIRITGKPDVLRDTIIRPYDKSDKSEVIRMLDEHERRRTFNEMLDTLAPAQVRFTLPVLVVSGKIVAFPTLDFATVPDPPIGWSVHYARNRRSTEFFFPGIKDKSMISWDYKQSSSSTDDKDAIIEDKDYKMSPLYYWENMPARETPSRVAGGQHRMLSFLEKRLGK